MVFFFINLLSKLSRFGARIQHRTLLRSHFKQTAGWLRPVAPWHGKTAWTLFETTVHFSRMWRCLAVLLLFVSAALAQEHATAYEALRVVARESGRNALHHIVLVRGVEGDPQPKRWNVILERPDTSSGVREVEVRDGRIASEGEPRGSVAGSAEGAAIDIARLNLDSSGAYALASHTAQTSHAKFTTVDYTLRTDERGEPVWIVTLLSKSSRPVGTIYIGATRGTVRRTEGMFAGATMEDVETEYNAQEGGVVTGIEARIKRAFHRTQEEARGVFERVKHSFSDFINRE
jgi:hypothetical protein